MTGKRKVWRLKIVIANKRTGQKVDRTFDTDGHGKLSNYAIESIMAWGSSLYASGWDRDEFSVHDRELMVREVLDVRPKG